MLTNDLLGAIFRILPAAGLCSLCETDREWRTATQDARREARLQMTWELVARHDQSLERKARMRRLVARTDFALPAGLTSVGDFAFEGCRSLATIELPDSLTSIGDCAFYCCRSLVAIEFESSAGLTTIGDCAFQGCSFLATIELPDGLTSIGHRAFCGCSSLTTIALPARLSLFAANLMKLRLQHESSGFHGTVTYAGTG